MTEYEVTQTMMYVGILLLGLLIGIAIGTYLQLQNDRAAIQRWRRRYREAEARALNFKQSSDERAAFIAHLLKANYAPDNLSVEQLERMFLK